MACINPIFDDAFPALLLARNAFEPAFCPMPSRVRVGIPTMQGPRLKPI